ncbi:MAG: VanZ family protein [Propionibacterium sp.]|nr:VanZ family protein [Propionibacterium sp.]
MPNVRKSAAWVLLALVLSVHLVTLYWPGGPDEGPAFFPHADKVVHVVAFGAPAYLLRRLRDRWWPILLLALHAPVSELIQHYFFRWRSGDPWDVVADLVGVAAGVLVARLVRSNGNITLNSTHT